MCTRYCDNCHLEREIFQYPKRGRGHSRTCRTCLDIKQGKVPIPCPQMTLDPIEVSRRLEAIVPIQDLISKNSEVLALILNKIRDTEVKHEETKQLCLALSETIQQLNGKLDLLRDSVTDINIIPDLPPEVKNKIDNLSRLLNISIESNSPVGSRNSSREPSGNTTPPLQSPEDVTQMCDIDINKKIASIRSMISRAKNDPKRLVELQARLRVYENEKVRRNI